MTPRSLFNIILKIFGLFFLREIINTIPQVISSALFYYNGTNIESILTSLIVSIIVLLFYIFLATQLLFKTNKYLDYLKLDQGFDEHELSFDQQDEFSIGLSSTVILNIALIVIAGMILTEEIPNFCRQLYLYFDQRISTYNPSRPDLSYMVFGGAKILIALLLLGERKWIINFIENRKTVYAEGAEEE